MSTPAIWNETFKTKASRYTRAEAEAAIADCHATLKANTQASSDYVVKTWCEIDAMRARIAELAKPRQLTPLEREMLSVLQRADAAIDRDAFPSLHAAIRTVINHAKERP
jgi:hypothetical protein